MCTRILCLGNDLLADDAFGLLVAERLRRLSSNGVQVTATCESSFRLLDHILDCSRLIVVDTLTSGSAEVGTIHVLKEQDLQFYPPGFSPHYVGLFETLALGRRLSLPVPGEVVLIAVEAADCLSVGGPMHPRVQAAVLKVVDRIGRIVTPSRGEHPTNA